MSILIKKRLNVTLFGSDYISIVCLKKLLTAKDIIDNLTVVVPHKDPYNQKSLKAFAISKNLKTIILHENVNFDMNNWKLPNHKMDLGIIVSFGYKIPEKIIESFKYRMINVHPSILPNYKGAAPIQHTILNNETEAGTSIIEVSPNQIDSGNILLQEKTTIDQNTTFLPLYERLSYLSANLLLKTIKNLEPLRESAKTLNLNHSQKTPLKNAPKIEKSFGNINFSTMNRSEIFLRFRALKGYISVRTKITLKGAETLLFFDDIFLIDNIKLNDLELKKLKSAGSVIFRKGLKCLVVKCKCGSFLGVRKLKLSGKKIMDANGFVNGFSLDNPERDFYFELKE